MDNLEDQYYGNEYTDEMLQYAQVEQDEVQLFKQQAIQRAGGDAMPEHARKMLEQDLAEHEGLIILANRLAEIYPPEEHPPRYEDLRGWKNQFKRFYITSIVGEDDYYIFRPILRSEYIKYVQDYAKADMFIRQQGLLEKCLLFPSVDVVLHSRPAGFASSLESKIMYQSGFLDDVSLLQNITVIK